MPFAVIGAAGISLFAEDGVPIFPDGFVTELLQDGGDFIGRAFVGNFELAGGVGAAFCGNAPFAGAAREDAAALGDVDIFLARTGVAAGFGMAAGADVGDADGEEAVAQAGGFAGGENEAGVREGEAKGADKLDELAIGDLGEGLEFASVGAEAREGNGDLGFPAGA